MPRLWNSFSRASADKSLHVNAVKPIVVPKSPNRTGSFPFDAPKPTCRRTTRPVFRAR